MDHDQRREAWLVLQIFELNKIQNDRHGRLTFQKIPT